MHLTMKSNFMSSTDNNEKGVMYSKSDSSIVMIGNHSEEIIQNLFHFLLHKNQINLQESGTDSKFIFDHVSGMHYLCNYDRPQLR